MRKFYLAGVVVVGLVLAIAVQSSAQKTGGPMLAHMVYFSLKDNSPAAADKLVAACKKHLDKHEGTVFFAAGTVAKEFDRPVNDRDYDVALTLVFASKDAHDKYQVAPRHNQFIDENKDNWKKVRVFDSYVGK